MARRPPSLLPVRSRGQRQAQPAPAHPTPAAAGPAARPAAGPAARSARHGHFAVRVCNTVVLVEGCGSGPCLSMRVNTF